MTWIFPYTPISSPAYLGRPALVSLGCEAAEHAIRAHFKVSANPSTVWYWNDWDNDRPLQLCSLAAQGLWMRMLSIAARGGGYVAVNGVPCTPSDLATLVGRPFPEVEQLLAELAEKGVCSHTRKGVCYNRRMVRDEKRRKINAKNSRERWSKMLKIDPPVSNGKDTDISGSQSETASETDATCHPKVDPPRARARSLSPLVPKKERKTPPLPPQPDIDAEFAEVWVLFPRKVDRGHALKAYRAARKRADADTIRAGVVRFAEQSRGKDISYVAHPATWLNGDRWLDERPRSPPNGGFTIGVG